MNSNDCFEMAAYWQQYAALSYKSYVYYMDKADEMLRPWKFLGFTFDSIDRHWAAKYHKKATDALNRSRVHSGTARQFLTLGFTLREYENK